VSTYSRPEPNTAARRRAHRAALRKRRRKTPPALWFLIIAVVIVLVSVLIQFAVHTYRTDPRDSRTILERELRVNTLQPRERVRNVVSVFQRPAVDYFRATRGLLVLTDRRLLFLGLQPRDLLASGEGPPTFVQRDYPLDTLVRVTPGRTFFFIAKALVVSAPNDQSEFGVPAPAWPRADTLLHLLADRDSALHAEGRRQATIRLQRVLELRSARVAQLRPVYYVVKRGDAVSTIATQWNTTPEHIRQWNAMPNDRLRVGQRLVVRR
jgi:LysM domain-containing protein